MNFNLTDPIYWILALIQVLILVALVWGWYQAVKSVIHKDISKE